MEDSDSLPEQALLEWVKDLLDMIKENSKQLG